MKNFRLGTALLLLTATAAYATSQDYFEFSVYKSQGTATINKYLGSAAVVEVPSVVRAESGDKDSDGNPIYRDYTVTAVGQRAFTKNMSITHVTIPSSVTITRRSCIFTGCDNLKAVVFRGSVVAIPGSMFSGCKNLESLTLDWKDVVSIGNCAFQDCGYDFGDLNYMPNLQSIGSDAFLRVSSLTSVVLTSLTRLGPESFAGCGNLESVTIDGYNLTLECGSWDGPFAYCPKLKTVKLGDGVVDLASRPFNGSTNLECVEIGKGVTTFKSGFEGQKSLKTFAAKGDVKTIPYRMFYNCANLTELKLNWEKIEEIKAGAFQNCGYDFGDLNYLPNVKSVESSAFYGAPSLTSVELLSLTRLAPMAFASCANLESVVIDGTDLTLECSNVDGPFAYCPKLKTVKLGDGVVDLRYRTFRGSTNLECVEIGKGVTTFSSGFEGQKSLKTFAAKGDVKTIPSRMFYGCENLTDLQLQWTAITNIESSAFAGCSSWAVEKLDLLPNLEAVNSYAFSNCRKIQMAVIPEKTEIVGDAVFSGCSGITNLVWLAPRVPNNAFRNCTSLSTIAFGQSMEKIAESAFAGCTGVRNVYFASSPPTFAGSFCPSSGSMARGWALSELDAWDAVVDKKTGMWRGLYMEIGTPQVELFAESASIPDGSLTLGWASDYRPPDLRYAIRRTVDSGTTEVIASNIVQNTSSITNTFVDSEFRAIPPFTSPINYEVVPTLFDIEFRGASLLTRNRKAVVVGCSKPFGSQGDRLSVELDAKEISELLEQKGGFAVKTVIGASARKESIQDALTNAVCTAENGDYVFFYIGAHGGKEAYDPKGEFVGNRLVAADQYYFSKDLLADVRTHLKPRPGVAFQGVVMACHSEGVVSDDTLSDDELNVLGEEGLGICLANESWIASSKIDQLSWGADRWSLFKKVMFDNGWKCAAADAYAAHDGRKKQDFQLTFAELVAYTRYLYDALPQLERATVFADKLVESVAAIPLGICEECHAGAPVGAPQNLWVASNGAKEIKYNIGSVDEGVQFCLVNVFALSLSGDRICVGTDRWDLKSLSITQSLSVESVTSMAYETKKLAADKLEAQVGVEAISVGLFNVSGPMYRECRFGDYLTWAVSYFKSKPTSLGDLLDASSQKAANGQSFNDNYILGLDPTDRNAKFCITSFKMEEGKPVVTYEPDLGDTRMYTILGADRLDGEFGAVKDTSRYFKVSVALPDLGNLE